MFVDGRRIESGATLSADICIVGAGAAGLTLVHALEGSGLSILLLDSGATGCDQDAQTLNEGRSNDPDYPFLASRARRFGGTTTRWTGVCIPLDANDFKQRSWLPHSGWPITYADLEPYYESAQGIFGLPTTDAYETPLNDSPLHAPPLVAKRLLYSNPLDLGRKFRSTIKRSEHIRCALRASVTQVRVNSDRNTVRWLDVATFAGNRFKVQAKTFILAAGGIENTRLLLVSKIGNENVGRYHMEHPRPVVAVLPLRNQRPNFFTNRTRLGKVKTLGTFGISAEDRQREQLMNIHLFAYRYHPLEERPAIVAAKRMKTDFHVDAKTLRQVTPRLHNQVLPYLRWHIWNKLRRTANYDHVRLSAISEQEPDPDNRITLADECDPLGVPLPYVRYRLSSRYHDSVRRSLEKIDTVLRGRGFGRLRYQPNEIAHLETYDGYGFHHMGSTRMSSDPKRGVVDKHSRVHGVTNLYVAGSSVFATGGAANPTLTIAALALRLADHIRRGR